MKLQIDALLPRKFYFWMRTQNVYYMRFLCLIVCVYG
jgi:hypothetical protein